MSTEELHSFNQVTEPLFISTPASKNQFSLFGLGSTHPPISERIKILRRLSHGASFSEYQKAYSAVAGAGARLVPSSALRSDKPVEIRQSAETAAVPINKRTTRRALGDLMMTIGNYTFLNCACGLVCSFVGIQPVHSGVNLQRRMDDAKIILLSAGTECYEFFVAPSQKAQAR